MITINKHNIHQWLLIVFAFSIPFFPLLRIIVPILTGLLIIERVIFYFSVKEKNAFSLSTEQARFGNGWNKYLPYIFISFFVIHLIGMLYTSNQASGWANIETKLTLFILPLIFLCYPDISKQSFQHISLAFVTGCFSVCVYLLLLSVMKYLPAREFSHLLYDSLSRFHHTSYLAMYLNWCIIILAYFLFKNQYVRLLLPFVFLIIFFSLFVLLLASKAGIIILAAILFSLVVILFIRKKIKAVLLVFSLIAGAFISYITIVPAHSNRVLVAAQDLLENKKNSSTHIRFIIWESGMGIIQKNWLTGVGSGDIGQALVEKYQLVTSPKDYHMHTAIKNSFNAHNQYIQTFAALGIIGELTLLGCLFIPFYHSIKQRNYLYLAFIILVAFNLFPESMLERQAGITFYAFFNILLYKLEAIET